MPDQRPAPLGRHRPEGIEVGTRSAVPAGRGQPACLRHGRQPDRHGTEKRADAPVPRMARRLFRPPCRSGARRARALFASRHRRIRPLAALPGQHLYRRPIRPPPSARTPYPLLFVRLGSTLRPAPQKSARRGIAAPEGTLPVRRAPGGQKHCPLVRNRPRGAARTGQARERDGRARAHSGGNRRREGGHGPADPPHEPPERAFHRRSPREHPGTPFRERVLRP